MYVDYSSELCNPWQSGKVTQKGTYLNGIAEVTRSWPSALGPQRYGVIQESMRVGFSLDG